MNFLSMLIPEQYKLIAKLILVCVFAASFTYSGYYFTQMYYAPKLEIALLHAKEFEGAYTSLASSSNKQNEAILKLQESSIVRSKIHLQGIAKAKSYSDKQGSQANLILLTKPNSSDTCKEASLLIDKILLQEREDK